MTDQENTSGLIDETEAARRGLVFEKPERRTCAYCGRELEPMAAVFGKKAIWVGGKHCGCPGEAQAERKAKEAEVQAARRELAARLAACGVGRRYLEAKVSTHEANLYLGSFGDVAGQGLYIYGDVGRGKTFEASALAREFVESGYSVIFTTTTAMLASIQETYNSSDSTATMAGRFSGCDILVLDDLGKESSSPWTVGMLFQVINVRYEEMKPVIVTSQYTIEGLKTRLAKRGEKETAEAIASRLAQTCKILHLTGPDKRLVNED